MAKNFGKAGSFKAFENTKKMEQEKAQVVVLQNVRSENLLDYPKNNEDISFTGDLEESMRQNGFTDPIEVTDFGMEDGKYTIVSGHRRRAAGVKVFGEEFAFPCLIRHFKSDEEVHNYVLFANSQRDSSKDPCLYSRRYKMHEDYLKSINFTGNMREEIAKRLGISVQQADRHKAMQKIILPVWDMVRAEEVGLSSVQPMAKHSKEEQEEIYIIMQDALKSGVNLTRDTVKRIVDEYRNGKKTWDEMVDLPKDSKKDNGLPANSVNGGIMNPPVANEVEELDEAEEVTEENHKDDVDFEPSGAEHDTVIEDNVETSEKEQEEVTENVMEEDETEEPNEEIVEEAPKHEEKKETPPMTEDEKQMKLGAEIEKQLQKLDSSLQEQFKCENEEATLAMVDNMKSVTLVLIDEMYRLAEESGNVNVFDEVLETIESAMEVYKA